MNRHTRCIMLLAGLGFAFPLQAQDGDVAIAYFVTTTPPHVLELEEGMTEHLDWHASQNDTWPGFVYQAMSGGLEYVWVSPGHTWADFDNPTVDPHADMVDFMENAGDHASGIDVRIWKAWTDVSHAPDPDDVIPIWEVFEFDLNGTVEGRAALMDAFAKTHSAMAGTFLYTVNEVLSTDTAPELFVAVAHRTMGELDAGDPNGLLNTLAEAHGAADAMKIMTTFEAYLTPKARRIWTLRQDLSYMPGT